MRGRFCDRPSCHSATCENLLEPRRFGICQSKTQPPKAKTATVTLLRGSSSQQDRYRPNDTSTNTRFGCFPYEGHRYLRPPSATWTCPKRFRWKGRYAGYALFQSLAPTRQEYPPYPARWRPCLADRDHRTSSCGTCMIRDWANAVDKGRCDRSSAVSANLRLFQVWSQMKSAHHCEQAACPRLNALWPTRNRSAYQSFRTSCQGSPLSDRWFRL